MKRAIYLTFLICTIPHPGLSLSTSPSPSPSHHQAIHTLLLCRHGNSIWNGGSPGFQETFTGWTDVPLSPKGITEARNTAKELALYSHGIDACFTSVLGRARETAHHCCWAFGEKSYLMEPKQYVSDYRLNERHYGALQGYVKSHVEEGRYGHDYHSVQAWRRSWYAVPPLLDEDDPRRIQEIKQYANYCGGRENVPRGESLAMVANDRIRPFLDSVLHPIMSKAAETKQSHGQMISSPSGQDSEHVNNDKAKDGGCGLVVAHANSLRALIGVICQVENDEIALKRLEAMKIETGVPLVLKYRQLEDGNYEACDVEEVTGLNHVGSPDLPVWPLSCIPKTYLTQSQQYQYERTIEMEKKVHVGQRRSSKKIRIDVI